MPHLFVDISTHGYGHLAQTAPVLNRLRERMPNLRLTIRCGLTRERLARRIAGGFEHIPEASDFGLVMKNALEADVDASLARYRAFHADWDRAVAHYAHRLGQINPDLVLANISYLALAAAQRAAIPAVALCSLNWAEIFYPYCRQAPEASAIRAQMLAAYDGAEAFLRITPGMAMPGLSKLVVIGPIARQGRDQRSLLQARLGLPPETRLVLVAMGGIGMRFSALSWPRLPGIKWIAPQQAGLDDRADVVPLETLGMDFSDLLASCDCVVTKSGYGTFVEAAVCGAPVIHVERPDWPEEPCLVDWLRAHGRAEGIRRAQLDRGDFGDLAWTLATGERALPVAPTGIAEAADHIECRLQAIKRVA